MLLVGLLTVPAAAAEPPPSTACEASGSDELHAVVTVPGVDQTFTENVTLHSNSTATVVLCDGTAPVSPDGDQSWSLTQSDAFTSANSVDNGWQVEITSIDTTVEVADTIDDITVDTGVVINTTPGATVESGLKGVGILYFAGQDEADNYAVTEEEYLNATASLDESASSVMSLTEQIETNGIDAELVDEATTTLDTLNTDYTTMTTSAQETRQILFETAFDTGLADDQHFQGLSATGEHEATTDETVDEALDAYNQAIENEYQSAADRLLRYMIPGLVVGLFLGSITGGGYMISKGRKHDHFRALDSDSAYNLSVLALPFLVVILSLLVAVVLLYLSGGWHAYQGVIS